MKIELPGGIILVILPGWGLQCDIPHLCNRMARFENTILEETFIMFNLTESLTTSTISRILELKISAVVLKMILASRQTYAISR